MTIAISVILSAFNALTLSPALAALLLQPKKESRGLLRKFLRLVQPDVRPRHERLRARVRRADPQERCRAGSAGARSARGRFLQPGKCPPAFCRTKIRATVYVNLQLPNASSLERTEDAAREGRTRSCCTRPASSTPPRVVGFSLLSFVQHQLQRVSSSSRLKPGTSARAAQKQYPGDQAARQPASLRKLPDGVAFSFLAARDSRRRHLRRIHLRARRPRRTRTSVPRRQSCTSSSRPRRKRPEIGRADQHTFLPSVPQEFVDVDRDKVLKQGVPLSDVYRTIQAYMGGLFVNYFNRFGRQWQVYVEAEGEYRTQAEQRRPVLRAQ